MATMIESGSRLAESKRLTDAILNAEEQTAGSVAAMVLGWCVAQGLDLSTEALADSLDAHEGDLGEAVHEAVHRWLARKGYESLRSAWMLNVAAEEDLTAVVVAFNH